MILILAGWDCIGGGGGMVARYEYMYLDTTYAGGPREGLELAIHNGKGRWEE